MRNSKKSAGKCGRTEEENDEVKSRCIKRPMLIEWHYARTARFHSINFHFSIVLSSLFRFHSVCSALWCTHFVVVASFRTRQLHWMNRLYDQIRTFLSLFFLLSSFRHSVLLTHTRRATSKLEMNNNECGIALTVLVCENKTKIPRLNFQYNSKCCMWRKFNLCQNIINLTLAWWCVHTHNKRHAAFSHLLFSPSLFNAGLANIMHTVSSK